MKNSNRILFTCFITLHGFPVAFRIRNPFFFFKGWKALHGLATFNLIIITLSHYYQTTVVVKDSPNSSGIVHIISDFWNIPALLLMCWLLCIFRSQLEGSLEGRHRSLWLLFTQGLHLSQCGFRCLLPLVTQLHTCDCYRLHTCYTCYTLVTLLVIVYSVVCVSVKNVRTMSVVCFISPLYPQNLFFFLAYSSCITNLLNIWNLSIHCIYAIVIAVC